MRASRSRSDAAASRAGLTLQGIHRDQTAVPQLVITLDGVGDERHYATGLIHACLDELEAFIADLYPRTLGMR
ncbi:MAG: hypothetical protein WED09_03000 [Homoserinimonas sp.]